MPEFMKSQRVALATIQYIKKQEESKGEEAAAATTSETLPTLQLYETVADSM